MKQWQIFSGDSEPPRCFVCNGRRSVPKTAKLISTKEEIVAIFKGSVALITVPDGEILCDKCIRLSRRRKLILKQLPNPGIFGKVVVG